MYIQINQKLSLPKLQLMRLFKNFKFVLKNSKKKKIPSIINKTEKNSEVRTDFPEKNWWIRTINVESRLKALVKVVWKQTVLK